MNKGRAWLRAPFPNNSANSRSRKRQVGEMPATTRIVGVPSDVRAPGESTAAPRWSEPALTHTGRSRPAIETRPEIFATFEKYSQFRQSAQRLAEGKLSIRLRAG